MKQIAATAFAATLLATPVLAQDDDNRIRDGLSLFGEATRLLLEGLADEMQPMVEDMRPFFEEEMLPFLQSLGALIDDVTAYEMPERLPNGDIIIRRSPDAPVLPEPGEGGDVEL